MVWTVFDTCAEKNIAHFRCATYIMFIYTKQKRPTSFFSDFFTAGKSPKTYARTRRNSVNSRNQDLEQDKLGGMNQEQPNQTAGQGAGLGRGRGACGQGLGRGMNQGAGQGQGLGKGACRGRGCVGTGGGRGRGGVGKGGASRNGAGRGGRRG